MMKLALILIASIWAVFGEDLFTFGTVDEKFLSKFEEDTSSDEIRLDVPVVFYGKKYETIFVNENGLLSFSTDVPTFFNIKFPLDYPIIAPFYSDVDIRRAGNIFYRSTTDSILLQRANSYIQRHFTSSRNFKAALVFIATWDRVGYYDQGADKTNTFQTVIATDGAESFSISIYTLGGLGWVKGTGKSSGQPDAKGQAGFSSGDGMYYGLTGSGTDQVRNLDRLSNVGVPGFWIFQISNVSSEHGIGIPDLNIGDSALFDPNSADSCEVGGTVCHSAAFCLDYNPGFCCECVMGYYGNGKSCLQDGVAQRINGRIEGKINNQQIDGFDIHSYVVVSDGRVYTAVSKVPDLLGVDLQPLVSLALPVSWAFSKQKGLAKNGFQLTGGVFNSTSIVSFPETGNEIKISHYFMGLDVYNYLEVLITIDGTIPALPENSKIEMPSHDEYYTSPARGILKSYTKRIYKFESSPKECHFTVDTTITFDACDWLRNRIAPQFLKVSRNFIVYDTREKILRFAATSKVSESDAEEDPCLQGTEVCSNNSMCVSTGDSFRCECKQGYEFLYEDTSSGQSVTCVDINECDTGLDQCHEHAQCVNELGSYSCLCLHGYHGDGFSCDRDKSCDTTNCGENTVCVEEINGQPKCRCLPGYKKDGDKCVLLSTEELYAPSCLTTSLCNENAACKYVDESNTFTCVCNAGYSGDGFVCIPDSENCLIAEFCSAHASCEYNNVTATYFCKCLQGYDGDGYECALHDNYDVNSATLAPTCLYGVCWCEGDSTYDGEKCISTSEDTLVDANMQQFTSCNVVNNCHPRAQCIYTSEADLYSCRCNAGYQGDGYRCALIIPEATTISNCDLNPDICHSNAFCAYDDDLLGSKCVCKTGFQGNGISCTGKDLCSESSDCDPNGSCKYNNIEGRYVCQCDIGYRGNGIFCEEDNEISDLSFLDYRTEEPYQYNEIPDSQVNSDVDCSIFNTCHRHATCIVDPITNLSRCVCLYGYSGDGQNCEELRPGCHVLNDCGRNAQCLYDVYSFSYKCQCNEGYKGDGYACNPLVNCDDDPSICDRNARCQLRQASPAQCVCKEGFIGDGFNCTALKKIDGNFLLIAQGMSILRVPFKPTHSDPGRPIQVQPFQTAIGVAIDCSEGKVYWGDVAGHTIKRSNYDGSNREHFLQNSAGAAEGIAIDHHSRVLYWVDSQSAKIEAASIDTQVRRTIVSSNLVNPRGIAVHSRRGKLYWSDWYREEPKIEVSNLDGSERSTFVREGLSLPNSLTIDDERDELCWTDAGYNRVECIGVDGEGRRSLNVNAKYPFGITNYEGQIYWTDWEEKKVLVADKSTGLYSGSIEVPFGGHGKLYGIVAVPNSCPTGDGPCTQDNGGCGSNKLCTTSIQFARVCL